VHWFVRREKSQSTHNDDLKAVLISQQLFGTFLVRVLDGLALVNRRDPTARRLVPLLLVEDLVDADTVLLRNYVLQLRQTISFVRFYQIYNYTVPRPKTLALKYHIKVCK